MASICSPSRVYVNGYYRRSTDDANNFIVNIPTQILSPKVMSISSATVPLQCYNFGKSECVLYFQFNTLYQPANSIFTVYSINIPTNVLYKTLQNFANGKVGSNTIPTANVTTNLEFLFKTFLQGNTIIFGTVTTYPTVSIGNQDTLNNPNGDGILSINAGATALGPNKINIVGILDRETNWNSSYPNCVANKLGFYNAGAPITNWNTASNIFTGTGMAQIVRTTAIYIGCDTIAGDTFTSNNNNEYINNILFKLPITSNDYSSLNTYTCQDMMMFKSRQLPYCISSFSITLYDDKFQPLELLPSAIVALELALTYEEDGTNIL